MLIGLLIDSLVNSAKSALTEDLLELVVLGVRLAHLQFAQVTSDLLLLQRDALADHYGRSLLRRVGGSLCD